MIGVFNTVTINGETIYRGNDFTLQREWLYAAEIETCTGKRCKDIIGWRYQDLKLSWDNLPQDQLEKILALTGAEVNMTFTGEDNTSITEKVIPMITTATITRLTDPFGDVAWKGVGLDLQFINAHPKED